MVSCHSSLINCRLMKRSDHKRCGFSNCLMPINKRGGFSNCLMKRIDVCQQVNPLDVFQTPPGSRTYELFHRLNRETHPALLAFAASASVLNRDESTKIQPWVFADHLPAIKIIPNVRMFYQIYTSTSTLLKNLHFSTSPKSPLPQNLHFYIKSTLPSLHF